MTETITIRKCDICGKEMNKWEHGFLKYQFTEKDYLGNGCATGGNLYNDICDTCGLLIDDAVRELIKNKRCKKEEAINKKFVDRYGECLTIEDSRSDHTVFEGTEEECKNYIESM